MLGEVVSPLKGHQNPEKELYKPKGQGLQLSVSVLTYHGGSPGFDLQRVCFTELV